MKKFNVLNWDFNTDSLEYYDVLPYLRERYRTFVENSKKHKNSRLKIPKTINEFKEFIENQSRYQFWARCEYEMICHGWPVQKNSYKLYVHEQIMMNIDIIAEILWNEFNGNN